MNTAASRPKATYMLMFAYASTTTPGRFAQPETQRHPGALDDHRADDVDDPELLPAHPGHRDGGVDDGRRDRDGEVGQQHRRHSPATGQPLRPVGVAGGPFRPTAHQLDQAAAPQAPGQEVDPVELHDADDAQGQPQSPQRVVGDAEHHQRRPRPGQAGLQHRVGHHQVGAQRQHDQAVDPDHSDPDPADQVGPARLALPGHPRVVPPLLLGLAVVGGLGQWLGAVLGVAGLGVAGLGAGRAAVGVRVLGVGGVGGRDRLDDLAVPARHSRVHQCHRHPLLSRCGGVQPADQGHTVVARRPRSLVRRRGRGQTRPRDTSAPWQRLQRRGGADDGRQC